MSIHLSRFSGDNFWHNIIFKRSNETGPPPGSPTVTTDNLEMNFNATATIDGTVVSEGDSDILSYGFVWAEHNNPTLDDNVIEVGTGSFTGAFNYTTSGGELPFFGIVYFAAYATNTQGTAYGEVLNGEIMICLVEGTIISLSDGFKAIEDVNYNDDLIVWNFDSGMQDIAKPVWMVRPFKSTQCGVVFFSDGSCLGTVADGKGHRIFNLEQNKFTHMMSEDTPIGTTTYRGYDIVSVVDKDVLEGEFTFYNIITRNHFNLYASGILTSTGLNNLYPIEGMKFVKDNRVLRNRQEFDVPDELFEGLRLAEQPLDYPDLHQKIQRLVRRQSKIHVLV